LSDEERARARWAKYYQAVADRPPRDLYYETLGRFEKEGRPPGLAMDLGCGTGIETADLLRRGWRVLAVDQQAEAIELTRAHVPAEYQDRLETRVAAFDALDFPPADFIWAGLSLPFCPPELFPSVWSRLVSALPIGGRFAGDFFGERHVWATRPGMTSHTVEAVRALCRPLHLEYFVEEEGERWTTREGLQHWHAISVVVRKD